MAMGDHTGLIEEWEPVKGTRKYSRLSKKLSSEAVWFSLHKAESRDTSAYGAWANRGMAVRSYEAKFSGMMYSTPHYSVYGTNNSVPSANVELSVPFEIKELQIGDYVKTQIVFIIMPQFAKDYYGPNQNLINVLGLFEDSWVLIHREFLSNEIFVTMKKGLLVNNFPVEIQAQDDMAHFIINSGIGHVPITISGLKNYRDYILEYYDGSSWQKVDNSVYGNDFWQTEFDPQSQTWQITYIASLDTVDDIMQDVEFRLSYE